MAEIKNIEKRMLNQKAKMESLVGDVTNLFTMFVVGFDMWVWQDWRYILIFSVTWGGAKRSPLLLFRRRSCCRGLSFIPTDC